MVVVDSESFLSIVVVAALAALAAGLLAGRLSVTRHADRRVHADRPEPDLSR